ncbi:MAG: hypothetical protein LBD64_08400 [Odoribacteraceae bacterium]|jgi:hypothetical protein|nr:hypothetical protein [Odoribacteraceae bacterium]
MRKHSNIQKLILLLAIASAACYSDKGNYDYKWIPGVVISGLKDTTVSIGERLRVEPVISSVVKEAYNREQVLEKFANPEDYSYAWEAWTRLKVLRDTLGTGMVLDTTINLAISDNAYWIIFKMTEKASGVVYQESFLLTVKNEIASGLVLLYEDSEGQAELDVAGMTPAGEDRYVAGVLRQIDYPFRGGGANFVEFEAARSHLWVGTGTGTSWLNRLTFEWKDTQIAQVHMTQGKPAGYTFKDMIYTQGYWFFITEDGEVSPYSSNASTTGLICASINLLPPGVSAIDGSYQEIKIAPYFGGGAINSALFWDETNKRVLKCPINSTATSATPTRLPDSESFHGHELRFMATAGQVTGAVLQTPGGELIYATYVYNPSGAAYEYKPEFTRVLTNTNGLLDQARNMTLSHTTTPFIYFSVGSKLYVYREGEGCAEVDAGQEVAFGEITCIRSLSAYSAQADLIVAANNPGGEGGTIYTFTITPTESKQLTLKKKIEGAPADVKDITYLN